jgi:hypothetical protein
LPKWGRHLSDKRAVTINDEYGYPVFFAAKGSPDRRQQLLPDESKAEIVTPDATSGPAEWGRYHDAVREAARSFDAPAEGDIHHFLNARARHPERVDVPAFAESVKRQRHADMVDILDHHLRRDGSLPRGSRVVRVQAPKGYLRQALRRSSPEELAHIRHRLTSIGHKQEHVDKYLGDRVKSDMWDQATSYEVRMSDSEFDGLLFDDTDGQEFEENEFVERVSEAISKIQPVINVYVSPEPREEN